MGRSARTTGCFKRTTPAFGAAFVINVLRDPYRFHLASGGLCANIGDGALTYRRENIFETFYSFAVSDATTFSFDYQFIANPGYNATGDRSRFWRRDCIPSFELYAARDIRWS